ncbi:DUF1934 domain-containing protein [Sporolactobacillus kofuensis]|uniref:DUF1934 domain-containing protein n=1 Tax=Sporolactobacillus kofuensis TaxID=269672 RepID=A0ABW1WIS5_9BACL|nr:DUF1934 domain-containing protein [Sporolactobacillus kofuensis]MCO7176297.1 DUF1934 domain-containing protein [Sporolactobacillus kofuensis]
MKTRDAEIVFTSRIDSNEQQPGQLQKTTARLNGRIGKSASSLYLTYNDRIAEGYADYTIRISGQEALILRKGAMPMRQPLRLGISMDGTYETAYGVLSTTATAEKIETVFDSSTRAGSVRLVYALTMQGQSTGICTLDYHYRLK